MSKPFVLFSENALAVICLLLLALNARGQQLESEVAIDLGKLPAMTVEVQTANRHNLSFARSIAGVDKLSNRLSRVEVRRGPKTVPIKRLTDGEYLSESDFDTALYELDLTPMKSRASTAHVSWFAKDVGILMGEDVLPQLPDGNLTITFLNSPSTSEIFSFEKQISDGRFTVGDLGNAVFYVGPGWRRQKIFRYKESAELIISGAWQFSDGEAAAMIGDILLEYQKLFGGPEPPPNVHIAIAKFPIPSETGMWEAETRGRNVIVISSDMPFKSQSLQRLHEQLRHEMFHLWIPNGVNLAGNYDWFYEGFALYESLKLAVRLNRIRFEDFLDTLSRAHTIDSAQTIQRTSLIQMSMNRFSGANTQVYARGMLVAFLCDLALLEQSRGKKSIEDVLRELFTNHRKPALPINGNAVVLALLKSNPNVVPVVEKYIEGSEKLEWASQLNGAGLEDGDPGALTNLRVKEKLNGRQKTLLDKLGYNSWRKLTPTSK